MSEVIGMALASVKAHKLRSGLTMFGIAIGVFSVIGVMTAISAMRGSIESGLNVLGANSFQVTKYPAIQMGGHGQNRFANRRDIDLDTAMRFKEQMLDSTATISLQLGRGGRQAFYADRRTNPTNFLAGSDENFITARDFSIARGRNITPEDVMFGRPVCVIGNDLVKVLFLNENPLDRAIRVDGQSFTVVGIFEEKGTRFGASQDNGILIPITRFLQAFGRMRRSISINVQSQSAEEVTPAMERSIGTMRVVRGLDPEDPNDFEIFSNDSLIAAFNQIAGVVAVGAFVISAIALLAAGIGIMNIMLVSVTERTKEIGIRKSLGARRNSILTQFLIEAIVISLIGGIIGILLGIGGGNIVALMLSAGAVVPWGWTIAGMLFCAGIGVTFGFYPAWKAARLDPIEALRFE
ncbi:MAG TPA: ABC transporter permease [Opitutaceae bacterium]|nr:ABC transporter permease [Opitutaceae bacterium]